MPRSTSQATQTLTGSDRPALVEGVLTTKDRTRIAGFFPGLGSRAAYQNLGRSLLDSEVPEVTRIYQEAARALGFPGRPDLLLTAPENLPEGKMERQGYVGAAMLVHSLALDAYLRDRAEKNGTPVSFIAYTGESFGILTAAVASGSLSVFDGVKIAQAFTPLMLLAAGARSTDEVFARNITCYLPDSVRSTPLIPEPSHVIAVKALDAHALATALDALRAAYPLTDVEVHKTYAPTQANIYVRSGVKDEFDRFVTAFPHVTTESLKDPTVFLAHSARMRPARQALEQFLALNQVRFAEPRVPVVSNHSRSLLTTAADVRQGVLAMTDQVMASQDTCDVLNGLDVDTIVELGPGNKSVQLLRDNNVAAPVMACTGRADTERFLRAVSVLDGLMAQLEKLHAMEERPEHGPLLENGHYDSLRGLFRLAAESDFCDEYFSHVLGRVITAEMLCPDREGSPAFYRFLEVFQHTRNHRRLIAADRGELVTRARLKKRITGDDPALLGKAYVELKVIDHAGDAETRTSDTDRPEVVVVHFDGLTGLDEERLARRTHALLESDPEALQRYQQMLEDLRADDASGVDHRVVYPYLLFHTLTRHRPVLFAQSDHYLEGGDTAGWLTALAVSGAVSLADVMALRMAGRRDEAVERFLDRITGAELPVVSPEGVPIQSRKDLLDATGAVLRGAALSTEVRRIHLNGNCQIISLGTDLDAAAVDAGPYDTHVVHVTDPAQARRKRLNPALDAFEYACVLALTHENERVLENAQSRRLLPSTVCAYVGIDESIVSFGKGGSESMTIFVRKEGEEHVTVRKILSEALTTARWDPDGAGVMLPPFVKAKRQAEYLQALPDSVRGYFPEVYTVLERDAPVPPHLRRGGRTVDKEVIYEMSYVAGEEVSRFVEKQAPPPAVVARLYELIVRVLNEDVHSVARVPAPGETLDVSYFRKIEDRLELCRRTAPRTFDARLLDTERIVINGVSYLNHAALLKRFRESPAFLAVLEPAFHSLVMGDTNTENIKVTDVEPLLHAQRVIESGAPREEVTAALEAITPASLGIKFLDPRAIGFKTEGRDVRDDPMYDNKPWHNSIGHYDEIHCEQFTMTVDTGAGRTPSVDIAFLEGNPYQRAYRVRDVVALGGTVDAEEPEGMEDHFASVMTAALRLDDPDSAYLRDDPYWLIRFVFTMGQHFTAMPPFHFQKELDGTVMDTYQTQRRPVAIYCEGIKWLNWALQMLEGSRREFLGLQVPRVPR
ncbi:MULTISPECIES: ACP S-malonyltransferase [Streptomyces]|uniref:ACP S-malonyltransferase n=1 Tax=Streptomyces TaxID=1883 RepID=UPI001E3A8C67|nr:MULTISPECIES: ACP S-malonyltransferase [Streptomyces]UFQ16210.1 ACP S-malonyltransferase [Streptomyces huasconensis]WCL85814.1 ACP S-malonyltransferase [Streptomyces sp. JCM 35825]